MEPTPLCSPLLFEGLTDHLRRLGFSVGVDHHLRLQYLLSHLYGQCSPEDLKSLICPVFAVNEKQQEAFYSAFDSFLPLLSSQTQAPTASESPPGQRHPEGAPPPRTPAKWPYVLASILVLALLIGIAEWKSQIGPPPAEPAAQANLPAPPAAALPSPEVADRKAMKEQAPPETAPTPAEPANAINAQPQGVGQPAAKPSIFERVRPLVARFPFDVTTVIVIFGPILFWVAYECYRLSQRRLILQKRAGRKPPHSWPIRVKGRGGSVYDSAQFSAAARRLHSRQVAESYHLDLRGTVQATTGSLGYPSLQYRPDTRFSEYLLLIDRVSAHDHQAALFKQLADALHGQGLYVQQYFFDGDPRICWSPEGNTPVRLSDLQSKYGGHRMLLIGDADRLTDPVTGRLEGWAHAFSAWTDRAILTPLPVSSWGARERTLAGQFIVLPATTDALFSLVGFFAGSEPSETRNGGGRVVGEGGWDRPPSESVERLRIALGPGLFSWLCACAIYPELHWDLTLYLASLPCMPEDLVTEANLLRLIGLPWFRTGVIPDEIRYELIRHLDSQQEREVRQAIVELLEQNPADEDTFAFETQALEIAVNRDLLRRSKKKRAAKRELLGHLSTNDAVVDHVVVRSLESVQNSPLDFLLPGQLRHIFYERGLSVLGLRTAVRFALTVAVVLIGFGAVSSWRRLELEHLVSNLKTAISQVNGGIGVVEVTTVPVGAVISVKRMGIGVVEETTFPVAAESGTATQALRLELPVGPIEIKAKLPGYQPALAKVVLTTASNSPVTLALVPVLALKLSFPSEGRVAINNEEPVTVKDGQFFRELPVGRYSVGLGTGRGTLAFAFEVRPEGPAVITGPPRAREVSALLISNFGDQTRIYTGASSVDVKLDGKALGQLGEDGLELPKLTPANHELELGAGKDLRKYSIEIGPERTLTAIVDSDPNTGTLLVQTNEDDVAISVLLNGTVVKHGISKKGTLRVANLKAGKYLVRAAKEGYDTDIAEQLAEVQKREDKTVSFQFRRQSLPNQGRLDVEVPPPGAQMSVDGRKPRPLHSGKNYYYLEPGAHTIVLSKEGYESVERKVELKKGETLPLGVVELKQLVLTASLAIEGATREAEVLIDGTPRGNVGGDGSFSLNDLSPGEHTIALRKADFEDKQLSKPFTVRQTVRISGADGQLTPFGTLDFRVTPPSASITYKRAEEAQTHPAENGKAVRVRAGRYVVTATANGNRPRSETVPVEPGKAPLIDWTLPLEEAKKGPAPPPKQTVTKDYFQDPAAWTQAGAWWIHKGEAVSWLRNKQGVYLIEFLRQITKIAPIKRTRHVDWVIDQRDSGNRVEYSFDFGTLERRATVDGKTESKKVKLPPAAASGDSYAIQIEIGPDLIVIRDAQGRELDLYQRPNRAVLLGGFGFKGDVALRIVNAAESTALELTSVKSNNDLRNLCSSLGNTLRKYPFQSLSADDASLEEFAGIFHPATGAIWQFQQKSLAELTAKEGSIWKAKDPAKKPKVTPELLAFLNRAQSIADAFYPGGATQAHLTYTLRPQLDPRLKESSLELEIDGQPYQLTVLRKAFNWPPPPGTKNVGAVGRLRSTTSNVGIAFASRGGIWGIFRILGDAEPRELGARLVEWKNTSGGVGRPEAITPAPVQLEIVGFPGGQDVFNPKFWQGLRCPSTAVQ